MQIKRLYHSARLLLCRKPKKRAAYLKKHKLLGEIGENCKWGPWLLPVYSELIRLHDNVHVHKTARLVPHDMLNNFLSTAYPDTDFGCREKIGCIELMDNVYISMNVVIMPNVRINENCIISAGSVVTSDIPANSLAAGIPAKPTGRFDMFAALRKMSKNQSPNFKHLELTEEQIRTEWDKFEKKREN